MEFFNRKEEVIDIQLTQYGKHLLSKGKFRPSYYAFFDDDILYDISYADTNGELQKNTEDRIKSTPRIKAQYNFSGRDLKTKKIDYDWCKGAMDQCNKLQVSKDKHYALGPSMGTSDVNSSRLPAWTVNFMRGSLTGSSYYLEGMQEETDFTFLSNTATDYMQTTAGATNKYIDLYSTLGRLHRVYFSTAANAASAPSDHPSVGTKVHAVSIDDLSTKEAIADKFKTVVSSIKYSGNLVFSVTADGSKITVRNKRYGSAGDATLSNLSSQITLAQTAQGADGPPKYVAIPQLEVDLKAVVEIVSETALESQGVYDEPTYADGTALSIKLEDIMIEVIEENSPTSNMGFDIEVFKVDEDENGIEELTPLTFQKPSQEIVNGILLDIEEQKKNFVREVVGPESVDYFFDLAVDAEIDPFLRRIPPSIYANRDPNLEEPCED